VQHINLSTVQDDELSDVEEWLLTIPQHFGNAKSVQLLLNSEASYHRAPYLLPTLARWVSAVGCGRGASAVSKHWNITHLVQQAVELTGRNCADVTKGCYHTCGISQCAAHGGRKHWTPCLGTKHSTKQAGSRQPYAAHYSQYPCCAAPSTLFRCVCVGSL
jgi:hypothetical protein